MITREVSIREVRKDEVETLLEIGKTTFLDSYSNKNVPSDIEQYVSENFNPEKIKSELSETDSQFFFAETDTEIIGYLKVNKGDAQTEKKLKNALEIERIYIISQFQGRGIGPLLIKKAIEIAKTEKCEYLWLGVWEKNPEAIRFYKKNGFMEFDKHPFLLGNDLQMDVMMKMKIK